LAGDRCVNGCSVSPANLIIFKENLPSDICPREVFDLLDLEGQLPDHWPTLRLPFLPTSPPVPNSLQMIPPIGQAGGGAGEAGGMVGEEVGEGAIAKGVVDGQAAMGADIGDKDEGREAAGGGEAIHDTHEMGGKGKIADVRAATAEHAKGGGQVVGDGDEGREATGGGGAIAGGNNQEMGGEDGGMEATGDEGAVHDPDDQEGGGEHEGREATGDEGVVHGPDDQEMGVEDEDREAAGDEGAIHDSDDQEMGVEDEGREATGDEGAIHDSDDQEMGVEDEGREATGRSLRPRKGNGPGYKEHRPPKTQPPKTRPPKTRPQEKKKMVPSDIGGSIDHALPQPGSYALPIDVDAWTVTYYIHLPISWLTSPYHIL
jgi:hypothetical protein